MNVNLSKRMALPSFDSIDLRVVGTRPSYGPNQYDGTKYLVMSERTNEYFIAHVWDYEQGEDIEAVVARLGACSPRILPVDCYPKVPTQDQLTLVYRYCNGGVVWPLHQKAMAKRKLPPKSFTCHLFVQLLEALLHLNSNNVGIRHGACHPANWFLDFPNRDLGRYPDVMLGGFEYARQYKDISPAELATNIVGDLKQVRNGVGYFTGENNQEALEIQETSDPYSQAFAGWNERIDQFCTAKEVDAETYGHFLSQLIQEAKSLLDKKAVLDLPSWMADHFEDSFAKYPKAQPARSNKWKTPELELFGEPILGNSRSEDNGGFQSINYDVHGALGGGMWGNNVRFCRNTRDGNVAALKQAKGLTTLQHEYDTILNLSSHPRINATLGLYKNVPREGYSVIILDFCNGKSVQSLTRYAYRHRYKIPQDLVCHIFAQLVEGLLHCYGRGIAHGECIPQNWYLKFTLDNIYEYPEVIIGDFGSAVFNASQSALKNDLKPVWEFLDSAVDDPNKSSDGVYDDIFMEWGQELRKIPELALKKIKGKNQLQYRKLENMREHALQLLKEREKKKEKIPDWIVVYFQEPSEKPWQSH